MQAAECDQEHKADDGEGPEVLLEPVSGYVLLVNSQGLMGNCEWSIVNGQWVYF